MIPVDEIRLGQRVMRSRKGATFRVVYLGDHDTDIYTHTPYRWIKIRSETSGAVIDTVSSRVHAVEED